MESKSSFIMWGERGLVATLLLDLYNSNNPDLWSAFLNACHFDAMLPWLKDPISSVSTVVEPDFSNEGFGHPDAIIRLGFESGNSAVVILEAKRLPYDRCCASPTTRGGAGYNSSLNGQVELNHCLAVALSAYRDGDSILSEPSWVLHSPYAIERRGRVRSLKTSVVIEEIAKPFSGLPFRSYYHLLITTDTSNPLTNSGYEALWPELYHPDYPFQNCWNDLRSQYGWASWDSISTIMREFVASGKLPGSLFLPTFGPNRRNFKSSPVSVQQEATLSEDDEHAISPEPYSLHSAPTSTHEVGSASSRRGATMIYAPTISSDTFLHFSWLNESCAIRNYSKGPTIMPFEDRHYHTTDVRRRITKEVVIRNRRPISDTHYWYETTKNLNDSELSGKSKSQDTTG